jgi:hypothetical protein
MQADLEDYPLDISASRFTHLPNLSNNWLFDGYIEDYYMTQAERMALIFFLEKLRPEFSIEIGTLNGGSLPVISSFSKKVYTLDIDATCHDGLQANFSNVDFTTAPSQNTLPPLLRWLQAAVEMIRNSY